MGQNINLSASPLQVIRTVNDKLMSYNVEFTEVTGGTFWKAYTPEQMQHQLDIYYKYIKAGKISGIIICSNCCADVGLDTVPQMQEWLKEHGQEEI